MNLAAVLAREFAPVNQAWSWRDAALYAVALGMGSDPLDADELPYVYEGREGESQVRAVPSYCVTLGWLPFWQDDPRLQIGWECILHGELSFRLHAPLRDHGSVRATHRIAAVDDKGIGRGAIVHVDKELYDTGSGTHLASLRSVEFLREDGGCGSHGEARTATTPLPADFDPNLQVDYATARHAALLYRLASRDWMPIHADPVAASQAGFERPISHGLHNLGLACRAVLKHILPGQPQALRGMAVRFAGAGYPGDTVRVELQRRGEVVRFRARALERDVLLLDRGTCWLGG